jgi:endonuclease/exonuclease/phosphatase family metal-dependent hydrolase
MRLMSYNIHKGIGGKDRRYDLRRIVAVIEQSNPDVVCLQEVTRHAVRTRGDDQPELLREALALSESAYQMTVHYRQGGYGNLILSRWPIVRRHHVSLRQGWRKPRGVQLVVVETPEGIVHIAHWHLGLAESERRRQTDHTLSHPSYRESESLPTLVVGDCNDWRNRLTLGTLAEQGFRQITAPPSRFRSFPAFLPTLSLDKAFQRGLFVRDASVIRTADTHRASDHLPLVIDFHLHDHELRTTHSKT